MWYSLYLFIFIAAAAFSHTALTATDLYLYIIFAYIFARVGPTIGKIYDVPLSAYWMIPYSSLVDGSYTAHSTSRVLE